MGWSDWLVLGSCVALEFSVIVFLARWNMWRSFPAYSIYILFALLQAIAFAVTLSYPRTYFMVYWLTAPVEILLTILATHESFWRVLRRLLLFVWIRVVIPAVGLVILA